MLVLANVSFSYQLAGGTGETQEWDVLNVEDCSWKMELLAWDCVALAQECQTCKYTERKGLGNIIIFYAD